MSEAPFPSDLFPFGIHDAIRWRSADVAALLHVLRTVLNQNTNSEKCHSDGRIWTYKTYENLADQLPWMMVDEVQKIVERLRKSRYLIAEPFKTSTDKYSNVYKFSLNEPPYQINQQFDMEV